MLLIEHMHSGSEAWASDFFQGALGFFSKIFLGEGAKSGEICFFPRETKKTTFF